MGEIYSDLVVSRLDWNSRSLNFLRLRESTWKPLFEGMMELFL